MLGLTKKKVREIEPLFLYFKICQIINNIKC